MSDGEISKIRSSISRITWLSSICKFCALNLHISSTYGSSSTESCNIANYNTLNIPEYSWLLDPVNPV